MTSVAVGNLIPVILMFGYICLRCKGLPGGFSIVCTGMTLQKVPDRVFDRTGTKLTCTLLATTITKQ